MSNGRGCEVPTGDEGADPTGAINPILARGRTDDVVEARDVLRILDPEELCPGEGGKPGAEGTGRPR
jgi:hypothetical protein